jgi:plasmid stabilization system protein ParE
MALEIVWTKQAEKGFGEIILYLESNFGDKEIRKFVRDSFDFFELLSKNPYLLRKSEKQKNLYRGPMNKYTILTYRVKTIKNQIELINIRSSRQKPL